MLKTCNTIKYKKYKDIQLLFYYEKINLSFMSKEIILQFNNNARNVV